MAINKNHKGKQITIHNDGEIFVDKKATGLWQWDCGNRYSNKQGQEQKDVKGKGYIEALFIRGLVARPWTFASNCPFGGFYYEK
jgi:hypothetical protein